MEKEELREIIDKLNAERREAFDKFEDPVLIDITFSDGQKGYYEVSTDGIEEHRTAPEIANRIILKYTDLLKVQKNKDNLLRFLMTGRIKLKGDVKTLMKEAEKIL